MRKLRRVWKYVPVECALADIKKGDLYQMDKFDESDVGHDPADLLYALADAKPKEDGEAGSVVIATRFIEDKSFGDGTQTVGNPPSPHR